MTELINRRQIVSGLGLGGLALAVGSHKDSAGLFSTDAETPLAGWLRGMIADLESARRVGQLYLDGTPDEVSRERLLADLFPRLEADADRQPGRRMWRDAFAAQCRQDFADGNTVRIDGWVLSRTEARLCALAALA